MQQRRRAWQWACVGRWGCDVCVRVSVMASLSHGLHLSQPIGTLEQIYSFDSLLFAFSATEVPAQRPTTIGIDVERKVAVVLRCFVCYQPRVHCKVVVSA